MSLSCSCDFGDEDAPWYWWSPHDYSEYKRWIGQRCCSEGCETMIRHGATTARIRRTRPGTEWENDKGLFYYDDPEAVAIAPAYLCEECADLYFSFYELGFQCVSPYENMRELAKEYHALYQTKQNLPAP